MCINYVITPYIVLICTTMGNEKANCFWEVELPPNYDRDGIENFIRAKYVYDKLLESC